MGIKGLRASLKEVQLREGHVKEWAGKKIVCDGFAWLHKGAYACATDLANGIETTMYLNYSLHSVKMMRHYEVTPIVILDGCPLPGKEGTNAGRREKREAQLEKGKELQATGDTFGAEKAFQSAVRVTSLMARELQLALKKEGVECIVAPFEADSQLAYMVREGHAHAAVTEDSDLIPYGVDTVLYKMDKYGNCTVLTSETLQNKAKTSLDIAKLSLKQRIHLCILAGCDYLPSIEGIGIRKALELIKKYRDGYAVIRAMRSLGKWNIPATYEEDFRRAEITFLCHRVYNPTAKEIISLTPIPEDCPYTTDELDAILGPQISRDDAKGLCEDAAIDPRTMLPFPRAPLPKPRPPTQHKNQQQGMTHKWNAGAGKRRFVDNTSTSGSSFKKSKSDYFSGHAFKSSASHVRGKPSGANLGLKSLGDGGEGKQRKEKERVAGDVVSSITASLLGGLLKAGKEGSAEVRRTPSGGYSALFALEESAVEKDSAHADSDVMDCSHHASGRLCDIPLTPSFRRNGFASGFPLGGSPNGGGDDGEHSSGGLLQKLKHDSIGFGASSRTPPTLKKAPKVGALDAFILRGQEAKEAVLVESRTSAREVKSKKRGPLDSFLTPRLKKSKDEQ